jgi:hypothetical protein
LTAPVVTGKVAVGWPLSTTSGTWTNAPTGYVYQWQRCSAVGTNCVNIASSTTSHYKLVPADLGHKIRSEVLASNGSGSATTGYAPSVPTSVVAARKPVIVTLPKVSGLARVGSSLKVNTGSWKNWPASYAYQWLLCTASGTSCKPIAGARSSSFLLVVADLGHKLKAKVTATNALGSVAVTTSNASATLHH